MSRLTQSKLSILTDGFYSDGTVTGLYYRVRGDYRCWVFRRQINGKRIELGLGGADADLSSVRREASSLRALSSKEFLQRLSDEEAAKEEKKQKEQEAQIPTFREAALAFRREKIEFKDWEEDSLTDVNRVARWENHVFPVIGDKRVDEVTLEDIVQIKKNIADKPSVVVKAIQSIKQVFDWAIGKKYLGNLNPGDRNGPLQHLIGKLTYESENFGAINAGQLPDFIKEVYESGTTRDKLLIFSILTATRSKTARFIRWEDIDWDEKLWWISRFNLKVKKNKGLVVPLSDQAIDILKSMGVEKDGWIFQGQSHKYLYASVFSVLFSELNKDRVATGKPAWQDEEQSKDLGKYIKPTQHGTARGTFCTWALSDEYDNDQRFDSLVVEQALHHKIDKKYNGAYNRNKYLRRRRELMQAWADFCFSKVKK